MCEKTIFRCFCTSLPYAHKRVARAISFILLYKAQSIEVSQGRKKKTDTGSGSKSVKNNNSAILALEDHLCS